MFIIQKDDGLLNDCGFSENDIKRLYAEFKKILNAQNEEYFDFVKDQEESVLQKSFNK